MATARDIVTSSLKILGVIASGETPASTEASDGLTTLNEMIESFSNENLMVPSITKETFTCVSNQSVHTLGSGGDFDTERPLSINKVVYQDPANSNYELPIKIIQMEEYAGIANKNTTSTIPKYVYIDKAYPLMNLYFWPVASVGVKAVIYSEKVIQSFASLNTDVSLPPGYLTMLKYSLAEFLSPEYGMALSQSALKIAMESRANIKRKNKKPRFLRTDAVSAMTPNPYDWRIGE